MGLNNTYEADKLQCCATVDTKKRCTRIGTHGSGASGVLCEKHWQMWMVKRANDKPIVKDKK